MAFAAVALLAGLAGLVAARRPGAVAGQWPPAVTAAELLLAAADARGVLAPLRAGEARQVSVRETLVDAYPDPAGGNRLDRDETVSEQLIPADPRDVWVWSLYDARTGDRISELRGRCGAYFDDAAQRPAGEGGTDPCAAAGTWQFPGPGFGASLPADSAAVLTRLRSLAAEDGADPDQGAWEYAAAALESGTLAPAVDALLYRAVSTLPGLVVTDRSSADGNGVAVLRTTGPTRFGVRVDDRSGTFLGHDRWQVGDQDGVPAGTLVDTTRVTSRVVSR